MWGIAASVVVTGAFLVLAPCSPVQLAAQALDGRSDLGRALLLDGRHLPTAAEVGRRAVEDVLGERSGAVSAKGDGSRWLREEMRRELRGLRVEIEASPSGIAGDGG